MKFQTDDEISIKSKRTNFHCKCVYSNTACCLPATISQLIAGLLLAYAEQYRGITNAEF